MAFLKLSSTRYLHRRKIDFPTKIYVTSTDDESSVDKINETQPVSQLFGKSIQKMLEEAQSLRLEAEQLEIANKDMFKTANNTQVMQAITDNYNNVPKSVLGFRAQELFKKADIVSKLNGELVKARYKQNATKVSSSFDSSDLKSLYPNFMGLNLSSEFKEKCKYSLEALERLDSLPTVESLYNEITTWWTRIFFEQAVNFLVSNWENLNIGGFQSQNIRTLTVLTELLHIAEILDLEDSAQELGDFEFSVLQRRLATRTTMLIKIKNRKLLPALPSPPPIQTETTASAGPTVASPLDRMTMLELQCTALMSRIQANKKGRNEANVSDEFDTETEAVLVETFRLLEDVGRLLHSSGINAVNGNMNLSDFGMTKPLSSSDVIEEEGFVIEDIEYNSTEAIISIIGDGTLTNLMLETLDDDYSDTAGRVIKDYFDNSSRQSGLVISREGAGAIQNQLLKSLFVVNEVRLTTGAAVFNGRILGGSTEAFVKTLREKLANSTFKDEVGFILLQNEKIASLSGGLQQAAIDNLLSAGPAVIMYPKGWESNVHVSSTNPLRRVFRSLLFIVSLLSSASFSASCFNLLSPTGPLTEEFPSIPDEFLYLTIAPFIIQFVSLFIETTAAYFKGVTTTISTIPSFTLPIFGSKVSYISLPVSRNDIFDMSALGVGSALLTSLITMYTGLQLSVGQSEAIVNAFPSVSISLLKVNSVVSQFVSYQFPGLFDMLATDPTATVHLHWLAIAGAVSMVYNTFQLFPFDNSAGSKMCYAYLGLDLNLVVSVFAGLFKGVFLITLLFTSGGTPPLTKPRIFGDFLIASQITGDAMDNPIAMDNLTEITEGRKILFTGFFLLLLFSIFNYLDIGQDASTLFNAFLDFGKSFTTQAAPTSVTSPINF